MVRDITKSLDFAATVAEIRTRRLENPFYGDQAVILYFGNICGRQDTKKYAWFTQPPEKKERYEEALISLIQKEFQEYPVIIGAIPPHAGSLYGFGSPLLGQSEVNPYRLATLEVNDMSVKKEVIDGPAIIGCPLDLEIMAYEMGLWRKVQTLHEYIETKRCHSDIIVRMVEPNKIHTLLKERESIWNV